MDKETLRIVMVGHLDHGKSTLIGRLLLATDSLPDGKLEEAKKAAGKLNKGVELSFLVDQFREEKEQERTIDTTQINIRTGKRNYLLIDAPGHAELIANMLTGASSAEAAVLVIDAHEGIKEQTLRHAYLIKLLGIRQVIVALNKMDLEKYSKERFEKIKPGLTGYLDGLGLAVSSLIPLSAKEDENISRPSKRMKWYKGSSLLQALDKLTAGKKTGRAPLRFCIQDVYRVNGKDVAAGKVISGSIRNGQCITLLPSLRKVRLGSIRVFGKDKKVCRSGENIGITFRERVKVHRGEVAVTEKDLSRPLYRFESSLFWLSPEPLLLNKRFLLRLATQEARCSAEKILKRIDPKTLEILQENAKELKVNEAGRLILRVSSPLVIENFSFIDELGRFVIEGKNGLSGVGIVTSLLQRKASFPQNRSS